MNGREEARDCTSVDWELVTRKRDWSSAAWTAAAVLVLLSGFFAGMFLRTGLTGSPDFAGERGPAVRNASEMPAAPEVRDGAALGGS